MMFVTRFPVLFTLAVAITGVYAQSLDSCGQSCIVSTVSKGYCSSANNASCVCSSKIFQTTLASCLTANCSTTDLTVAQELQKETCGNVSTSSTAASAASTPSASGTNSVNASSTPSNSTTSNGATVIEQLPLLSAVIVIAGALMGGTFVL